jgi:hypothetical protein
VDPQIKEGENGPLKTKIFKLDVLSGGLGLLLKLGSSSLRPQKFFIIKIIKKSLIFYLKRFQCLFIKTWVRMQTGYTFL